MGLIASIRRWWSGMFSKKDIEQALQIEVAITEEMRRNQEKWRQIFNGKASWNNEKIKSRRLAKGICNKIAKQVTVKFTSEISGDNLRAKYLNEQYQRVIAVDGKDGFRTTVEKACAGGTIVFRPFVRGDEIRVRVVENDSYYPMKYNEVDELISAIFTDSIQKDDYYYTLLEKGTYDEKRKTYQIEYTAWLSNSQNALGKNIPLTDVPEWSELLPSITWTDVEFPWFVEFVMPELGTEVERVPQGSALFSNAIDDLEKADRQEELIEHEFHAGRLRQQGTSDLFRKDMNGNYIMDSDIFQVFEGVLGGDNDFIRTYNPEFRIASLKERDNDILRHIEFACEVSYGLISDVQLIAKTATEVRHGEKDTAVTVDSIKGAFEPVLKRVVDIMNDMATRHNLAPLGEYDTVFYWDDSTVISEEEKQNAFEKAFSQMMVLFQQQLISGTVLLAFYNENSDYLSKITPKMQEEVEKLFMPKESEFENVEEEEENE